MKLYNYITEDAITDKVFEHLDIVESCYAAIDEGVNSSDILDIAVSNSTSMIISYLDACFKILDATYERLISYINNFILNYAKLVEKYKNVIIKMYSSNSITEEIIYKTYTYPNQRTPYPALVEIDSKWYTFVKESKDINIDSEEALSKSELKIKIDDMLKDYADQTLSFEKLHTDDIEKDVRKTVKETLRGSPRTILITEKNISNIIDNIVKDSKKMLEDVKKTKTLFQKDYKTLQKLFAPYPTQKINPVKFIHTIRHPDLHTMEIEDARRFSDINFEMNRFFMGIITMYKISYATKFDVIKEHIDSDREFIVVLLQTAGAFAAINNKKAASNSKPMKIVDKLDRFKL